MVMCLKYLFSPKIKLHNLIILTVECSCQPQISFQSVFFSYSFEIIQEQFEPELILEGTLKCRATGATIQKQQPQFHWSYVTTASKWNLLMCLFLSPVCVNVWPQWGQEYGLSPVCILM